VTKPVLQALVLADHIYQDRLTGKMIIAGTFTRLTRGRHPQGPLTVRTEFGPGGMPIPPPPPADAGGSEQQRPQPVHPASIGVAGSPFVYVCLTDIHASAKLELRYVDLLDHKLLMRCEMEVRCNDPLLPVEISIPLPAPLPAPHDGVYSMELLCEEELLGSWRVSVTTGDGKTNEERP